MPKVIFRYSWPYDLHWDEWKKSQSNLVQGKLLNESAILDVIAKVEGSWRIIEKDVLEEISEVIELKWQEEIIFCYIVSNARALSDPLTVGINQRKPEKIIETLMHELTHRIFIQDGHREKTANSWQWVRDSYPQYSKVTYIHIICLSLLKHLYFKFLNQKRLKEEIQRCEKKDDYRKAWEVIEKEDYLKILAEFKKNYF